MDYILRKADLGTARNFIICPLTTGYHLDTDVKVLGIGDLEEVFEDEV